MLFKIIFLIFVIAFASNNAEISNLKVLQKIREINLRNNQSSTYRILTKNNPYQFRYLPVQKKGYFEFLVKAEGEAHISLSNAAQFIDPKVFIVIGGCQNTVSIISVKNVQVIKNNTPQILDKNEYRSFWIIWSEDGDILVGKKNESMPFLLYKHTEQLFPINFVGVASNLNSEASWIINEDQDIPPM